MKINLRSIRVRLCLWYVIFTLFWTLALGAFSYTYLAYALASSRKGTLVRRADRLTSFVNYRNTPDAQRFIFQDIQRYFLANPDSDIVEIDSSDGHLLYPAARLLDMSWPQGACPQPCFGMTHFKNHSYRTITTSGTFHGKPVIIHLGGSVDEHNNVLNVVLTSYVVFMPLLLVAAVAGGFGLSHRALAPVARITNAARNIDIRDLHHRLPVPDTGDELQDLAETWNQLLSRLDHAVDQLTQFTSDVSHDLRTSISVMLSTAELSLRRTRSVEKYQSSLSTIRLECLATTALLDDLLAAARADVSQHSIEFLPVNLKLIAAEAVSNIQSAATIKHLTIECNMDQDAWVHGDTSTLRRLVHILLDNAVKYTPDQGIIGISLRIDESGVSLQICDNGIGISCKDAPRIFDRFYRADSSRNRDQGGSGLGLAIAKWISETHSATLAYSPNQDSGSIFTVLFPAYAPETALVL
jgi:signal transduction histidine kinase